MNITAKSVSVKENFAPKGNSDNYNVAMQQGLDAKENQGCTCRHEINRMLERIKSLEEQRKIDRFMLSDSDITFYTGLPD